MKNFAPIHIDRLTRALERYQVKLKRAEVIEIAAAAFGYHNSNEFQAAARSGDLSPPPADPVGSIPLADGTSLVSPQGQGIERALCDHGIVPRRCPK